MLLFKLPCVILYPPYLSSKPRPQKRHQDYDRLRTGKYLKKIIIQSESVARDPKLFIDISLGPLAKESPCISTEFLLLVVMDNTIYKLM